jgi:hypothetical protein
VLTGVPNECYDAFAPEVERKVKIGECDYAAGDRNVKWKEVATN